MLKNKGRTEDKTNKLGETTIINDVSLLAYAKTYCFSDVSAPIAVIVALTPHMRLLRSPYESVCPLKICQTCCFQFLKGILLVPRDIENNDYPKFGGGGTNCIMGNVKVTNYVREKQSHPQFF